MLARTPRRGRSPLRDWRLKTGPAVEPVGLDGLKLWARIDTNAEDELLATLIATARQAAEEHTRRAFIRQEWTMAVRGWTGWLPIPRPPLIEVLEVRSVGFDGAVTVWPAGDYLVRGAGDQGQIMALTPVLGLVEIDFAAGYGPAAADVPAAIRTAVTAWASELYESRTPANEPPQNVVQALAPWRVLIP